MGLQLVFQIINLLSVISRVSAVLKSGCLDIVCGRVIVPYPFRVDANCWANESYSVYCRNNTRLFLKSLDLEVLNISLVDGTILVNYPIYSNNNCLGRSNTTNTIAADPINLEGTPYVFSETRNIFFAAGCNKRAVVRSSQNDITFWGCDSACDAASASASPSPSQNSKNSCTAPIPSSLQLFDVTWDDIINGSVSSNYTANNNDKGCAYAFPVQIEYWRQHLSNSNIFEALSSVEYLPVVFDWYFDYNESYIFPSPRTRRQSFYCDSITRPYNGSVVSGNACSCAYGFEGNAYIMDGCQDIDECSNHTLNQCGRNCVNTYGYYRCDNKIKMIIIGVCSGFGSLLLLACTWWLYIVIKKRNILKRKQKFFKRNGGLLLQQQLSASDAGVEKTKVFNSIELEIATDNYNENRVLGQGGQGTVYKGMLTDGRIVAIKKSKMVDEANIEQFINEVVIVSQINQRNIVKLLGCCLETEVPLLVYEFISNGTLFQHIHDPIEELPLSWEMRLRIATEIAGALFYLHSAASIPIYHRDIKSTNILLDHKYIAKVSDFGTSRSIAIDQTHLTTIVQGTFGYLDPEYFQSSQFTDKSDVYSFGVVMVELLTGEKPISTTRSEESRSLTAYFIQSIEENKLFDILDPQVIKGGKKEEIVAVAQLAKKCLHLSGKQRPTMREVAVGLEGIRISQGGSTVEQNCEEVECITIEMSEAWDITSTSTLSCFDIGKASSLDVQPLLFNKS